jgi:CheY-like chemotaxis protein
MTTTLTTLAELRAHALAAWQDARTAAVGDAVPVPDSREDRMDLERRREVFARQAEAIENHEPRAQTDAPRVVVARRQEWAAHRLATQLTADGYDVVAVVVDGADAVGICVTEQPDLLLVEDVLMRMTGGEVLEAVRALCPDTRCIAQIGGAAMRDVFLAAGAHDTHLRNAGPQLGVPHPRT